MKLLHTADWQLGAKLVHAGERAPDLRRQRFKTAEAVVEVARDEEVDFVVIAGDLFEDHSVADKVVHRAVRILDEFAPIPVYVLPGNHDPFRPGGIWDRPSWKAVKDHVHLLKEPRPIEPVEGVVLLSCPVEQKRSTRDPTENIPLREEGDDRVRIGIAHGALSDVAENPNCPIDPGRPQRAGLDYLALGDWHGTVIRDRLAYSGTIEQSGFGESDPGNVLLVELEEEGDEPAIEKRRVGRLRWVNREIDARDLSDVEALEEELSDLGDRGQLVLRLEVRVLGDADREVVNALDRLRQHLEDDTFYLDWRLDDGDYLISTATELPSGLIATADQAAADILEGNVPDGPVREFANRDPEVVMEARTLLRRIAREELG